MSFAKKFVLACLLACCAVLARAESGPIVVGDVSSYSTFPAFTVPYRNGWQLAVDEINAAGGLLGGRKLKVVSRDDAGKPDDATRHAAELVTSHKAVILTGAFLSNVGLALADYALRNKIVYLAAEPLSDALVWDKGNRYTFRLRPSTYMQAAMLVEEAAKLPAKRWATLAPNYEYGQSAVASFKSLLKAKRPDVEFVVEQWPALGKLEAGATVQALAAARPEAIFNVTFGADLTKFVREGNLRGLFEKRLVVSMLTGEPEYLDTLKDETPEGWIVTGYPWDQIKTSAHQRFVASYRKRFNDYPRLGSVVGYATLMSIAAGIKRAGDVDSEKLVAAFRNLSLETPLGRISYRASDHQSTLGAYVGRLALKADRGVMTNWRYADGQHYMPSDETVKQRRPAAAMQ